MVSKRKELSIQPRAFEMPVDLSGITVVRWIPAIPGAFSVVLKESNAPTQTDAEEVHPLGKPTTSERETTPVAIYKEASDCLEEHHSPLVKPNTLDFQNDSIYRLESTSMSTRIDKEENLELAADAIAAPVPNAFAAGIVDTWKTQALPDPRSRDTRRQLDYFDIKRQRDQGQTWAQINRAYGREVHHTFNRMKQRSNPIHTRRRGPQRKLVSSDCPDIKRRRDQGQTWAQINRAYGRDMRNSFSRWKQQSNPIHTQTRGPRRCAKEILEIEQQRDRGDSWAEIKAVHGGTAESAYRFWKYSGRPHPGQRQPEAHTTPEQFAAIYDLRTNTRTTWPTIGEQFGVSVNTIRLRYRRWMWSQDNDQHEPYDTIVNSLDAESFAGSECRTTTAGTLTGTGKEENPTSSCYTRDMTSFDFDNSDDSSTIVVQPRALRSKALSLLGHFEN
jgi:hypothetical protein